MSRKYTIDLASTFEAFEAAGSRLFAAMSEYRHTVLALKHSLDVPNLAQRNELLARVNQHLASFDSLDPRSHISQLRNDHGLAISLLPAVVLTDIFRFAIGRYLAPSDARLFCKRTHVLTAVCQRWRCVMISTRTMWALVPPVCMGLYRPKPAPSTALWLERSDGVPLHFDVVYSVHSPLLQLPTLAQCADRLTTPTIHVPGSRYLNAYVMCWLEHGAPGSITELRAGTTNSANDWTFLLPTTVTDTIPQATIRRFFQPLKVLEMNNVYLDPISAAHLEVTILCLCSTARLGPRDLARMLTGCPSVESLTIEAASNTNHDDIEEFLEAQPCELVLPRLQSLVLDDLDPAQLYFVLRSLQNALFDIHLQFSTIEVRWGSMPGFDYWDLMRRVLPKLKVRTLSLLTPCSLQELQRFLQLLPSLDTVCLSTRNRVYSPVYRAGWKFDSTVLHALTRASDQPCASLSAIHLAGTIEDQDALKAMISSHQLQQFCLDTIRGQILDKQDELRNWISSRVHDFQFVEGIESSDFLASSSMYRIR